MTRDVYLLFMEWLIAPLFWPYRAYRRWKLRRALRKKMKMLGMIPMLALCAPHAHAQQADSLIGTTLSRGVIPAQWQQGQLGIYCLTWIAQREDRPHVMVIIDATVADPQADPLCPDGKGGFYPIWVDGPLCPPGQVSPFKDREFVIVRCGEQDISRYKRPGPPLPKKAS